MKSQLTHDLLTDCLGYLVPRLSLTAWSKGTWDSTLKHWSLSSTCDQIPRGAHCWTSYDDARRDLMAAGFDVEDCPESYDARMCSLGVIHRATQLEHERAKQADDAKWLGAESCFVRYGKLPASGRSMNHADGVLEAGVSVFRGQLLESGEARPVPGNHVEFCSMVSLLSRPLYIVAGEEIGMGSDGEPLLAVCKIVKRAK